MIRITVPPKGPSNARIVICGEQPGRQEVHQREPFVGPAGKELTSCLNAAGISRYECYLTNVIKDLNHPLEYYIDLDKKPIYVSPEGQEYINLLKEELEKCRSVNVIVALGNIALFALCNRVAITKRRGSILKPTLLSKGKIIPTLHPATIIPPKNQYLNRHLIIFDLKKARRESKSSDTSLSHRSLVIRPSFHEAISRLGDLKNKGLEGAVIDYDIELFNEEVSCISFASSSHEALCIPFIYSQGDYFTPDQEIEIWLEIASVLENPEIRKRGQNIAFDAHFLLRRYGIKSRNLDDTMVAQKILFPDYPVGLHFITTMYTDIPYYKDDGKRWAKTGDWDMLWRYNNCDSVVCAEAGPKQILDLKRQGNLETYERQRKLIPPLVYMMEKGIRVDVEGMKKEGEEYGRRIEEKREELNKVVGREINANSSKQLIQYFYIEKGYPPYRGPKGNISTDEDALKRLARKGVKEATIIGDIRGLVKLKSTYLNVDKVDDDGRIRCSYNPVGTRFSRISSSESIFGTGMNMQNWPHECLKFLLPDEGYIYYALDLSQAENRIVAYIGRIPQMIEAFESGLDVHKLTGALIFNKSIDEVSTEPGSCSLGSGRESERAWARVANHAFNYDLGYKNFSLKYEIPEKDGKWILERYHTAYPGVRQSYHTMTRNQLAKDRTLTNLMGRRTLFLEQWGDKLFKAGYSCIPQGTVGDVINERGINFIYYNQQWFKPIELLAQIHDSIGFQVPLPAGYMTISEQSRWLNRAFTGSPTSPMETCEWIDHAEMIMKIKESLETPLIWHEREFVVPVDLVMGLDMFKEGDRCREIKHGDFPTSIEGLARRLEENYENIRKSC